ncbi:hypothetical protein CALCODRAFT_487550 [Calocera cornea HHB12733]|uniref:Mid2 domain-containing protein n=1 Tax=Calocera cornea HHB12733 TaxID=1353952 RepID=A0A165D1S9_9BASI|nr:hypothetical protein CALCODRAFT_487550 [Calocera cornea HHB12733]
MIQQAQDFDLVLAQQISNDGIPDTSASVTHEVAVSKTAVGALVSAGTSRGVFSTSWISSHTSAATSTTHSTSSSSSRSSTSTSSSPWQTSTTSSTWSGTELSPATKHTGILPPAAPTSPSDNSTASTHKTVPLGAIIGAAVGGAALLAILIVLVLLCRRRKRRPAEYRVSLIPGGPTSPGPEPTPWFPPMPMPAPLLIPPSAPEAGPPSFRASMYELGGEAVPYASASASPSGPERTLSGYTEDEKRPTGYGEEKKGGWVPSGYGYSRPERWSPLPPYHSSSPSASSFRPDVPGAFAALQKMYPPTAPP